MLFEIVGAGLFGDHDCTGGHVGMVCQQNSNNVNHCEKMALPTVYLLV